MNALLLAFLMAIESTGTDGTRSVENVEVPERDGVAVFRMTQAEIVARKAKRLALTPDFARARKGEDGFWVFPTGQLGTFRCDDGRAGCTSPSMSLFGMKTPRRTFVALVRGLKYYFHLAVEAKKGAYAMSCVLPDELCADPYEDFEIEFRALTGTEASLAGMARVYRNDQLGRGVVKPLRERVKDNPVLKYAVEAPEIRIRLAWKPVPSPVPDQQPENEPPLKPVVTFGRVADIAREFRRQDVGKAELCLVGWNVGGHDGRYPQMFPVEPALGGEAGLRTCVRAVQDLGYQIVPHGNFRDAYLIADCWDAEWTVKNADGTLKPAHTVFWGGGCPYEICAQRAYEKFAVKDMPRLAAFGFKGMGYFDVVTILKAPKCDDPRHRCSRADSARYWGLCAEVARKKFGGFASEGSLDHFAGSLDSVLYASFGDPRKTNKGLVDRISPIWQMVYNGIIVNNPFTTTVNFTAQDGYSQLKLLEFGGRPNFYFYSKFVSDGKDWMGDSDLRCGTDEELVRSVARVKAGWDVYAQVNHLQYEFIEGHDEIASGVWRTSYSNGERMYVNYNASPVTADGVALAAEGWKLVR